MKKFNQFLNEETSLIKEETITSSYDRKAPNDFSKFRADFLSAYEKFNPFNNFISVLGAPVTLRRAKERLMNGCYDYPNGKILLEDIMRMKADKFELECEYTLGNDPTKNKLSISFNGIKLVFKIGSEPIKISNRNGFAFIDLITPDIEQINDKALLNFIYFIFDKSKSEYLLHFDDTNRKSKAYKQPLTFEEMTNEIRNHYQTQTFVSSYGPYLVHPKGSLDNKNLYYPVEEIRDGKIIVKNKEGKNEEI